MIQLKKIVEAAKNNRLLLAAAGAFVLIAATVTVHWWRVHPGISAPGRISAVVSVLLFSGVCVLFLRHWISDWQAAGNTGEDRKVREKIRVFFLVRVFLSLLALDVVIVLFVYVLRIALNGQSSFGDSLVFWTFTDSQHYLAIAKDWYLSEGSIDRLVQLVFLPGYPLIIRAANLIVHNWLYAGMLVSAVAFAGAGTVLYCLAREDMDHQTALRALRYACLLPGAFFYAAPMSESLFLLLSVSCVYLTRKKLWLHACILGGLASFTRSLGLMLVVPVGYEFLTDTLKHGLRGMNPLRRAAQFALLLLIPAGFGAYCLICRDVSGNPFQWMIYQREHWNQQLGLFFHTAAYQTNNAIRDYRNQDLKLTFGLWLPNMLCSFSALAVMASSVRMLRASYGAYFIVYYAVAIGATWLLSAPRYLLVLFPVSFGMAELTRDRRIDVLLTILTTIAGVLYILLFAARWQVW